MGNALRSVDDLIRLSQTHGVWRRALSTKSGATTAATANCGKVNVKRFPDEFIVPTLGAGVTAAYFTEIAIATQNVTSVVVAAHETLLGTLTVSGNVFTAGSAMPTKTIDGASVVTATVLPILAATVAITATTPVITITYVNQDGVGSRTATMTMPTNSTATSAYLITPHLQAGDTGIRSVTNIGISAGSAGTFQIFGLLPQAVSISSSSAFSPALTALRAPFPMIPFVAGDCLAFYQFGVNTAVDLHAAVCAVGDD